MTIADQFLIIKDFGSGQPLVVVFESQNQNQVLSYFHELSLEDCKVLLVSCSKISDIGCDDLTEGLLKFLDLNSIKQATLLGVAEAGAVVQNFTIAYQRRVRRLILLDSPTRPYRSKFEKLLEKIEKVLPLGLPFRAVSAAFDSRSFLQRIRCPALIITTPLASGYIINQSKILINSMATAWGAKLELGEERKQMLDLLTSFFEIPAKRPQKIRGS
ncbi:MAG: alpha/beta hydrolase [bacterium]|nr:alpha/beta hydrolase [bacterium]